MKYISFELSFPNKPTWNGRSSMDGKLLARVKTCTEREFDNIEHLIGKNFFYRWEDGWTANVHVTAIDSREASKVRAKSAGFCGYEWFIDSLLQFGEINYEKLKGGVK